MNIVNGSGPKVVVGNKKDTKSSTSTRKISCSKENSALGRDRKAPKGVGASKPLNRDTMRERFSSNISTESVEEKKGVSILTSGVLGKRNGLVENLNKLGLTAKTNLRKSELAKQLNVNVSHPLIANLGNQRVIQTANLNHTRGVQYNSDLSSIYARDGVNRQLCALTDIVITKRILEENELGSKEPEHCILLKHSLTAQQLLELMDEKEPDNEDAMSLAEIRKNINIEVIRTDEKYEKNCLLILSVKEGAEVNEKSFEEMMHRAWWAVQTSGYTLSPDAIMRLLYQHKLNTPDDIDIRHTTATNKSLANANLDKIDVPNKLLVIEQKLNQLQKALSNNLKEIQNKGFEGLSSYDQDALLFKKNLLTDLVEKLPPLSVDNIARFYPEIEKESAIIALEQVVNNLSNLLLGKYLITQEQRRLDTYCKNALEEIGLYLNLVGGHDLDEVKNKEAEFIKNELALKDNISVETFLLGSGMEALREACLLARRIGLGSSEGSSLQSVLNNHYFETIPLLTKLNTMHANAGISHIPTTGDHHLLYATLHNSSGTDESAEQKIQQIATELHDKKQAVLVLDTSLELSEHDLRTFLSHFEADIESGKLVVVLAKSLTKFASLGTQKVMMGAVSIVANNDNSNIAPQAVQLLREAEKQRAVDKDVQFQLAAYLRKEHRQKEHEFVALAQQNALFMETYIFGKDLVTHSTMNGQKPMICLNSRQPARVEASETENGKSQTSDGVVIETHFARFTDLVIQGDNDSFVVWNTNSLVYTSPAVEGDTIRITAGLDGDRHMVVRFFALAEQTRAAVERGGLEQLNSAEFMLNTIQSIKRVKDEGDDDALSKLKGGRDVGEKTWAQFVNSNAACMIASCLLHGLKREVYQYDSDFNKVIASETRQETVRLFQEEIAELLFNDDIANQLPEDILNELFEWYVAIETGRNEIYTWKEQDEYENELIVFDGVTQTAPDNILTQERIERIQKLMHGLPIKKSTLTRVNKMLQTNGG